MLDAFTYTWSNRNQRHGETRRRYDEQGDLHAAAAVQPDALAAHWTMDGANDRNVVYAYDHTVQTGKTTRTGTTPGSGTTVEDVTYTYDLRGRLSE